MRRHDGLGLWLGVLLAMVGTFGTAGCAISLDPGGDTRADGSTPVDAILGPDGSTEGPDVVPMRDVVRNPDVIGCRLSDGTICPANTGCSTLDNCEICFCSASLMLSCQYPCVGDGGPPPDVIRPDAGPRACRSSAECGVNEVCEYDSSGCGTVGFCATRFECGMDPPPYCGCDGQTYFAECGQRTTAWVHDGPCMTGCRSAFDCTNGQSCVFPPGCGDVMGTCEGPLECPGAQQFCGCNGMTFSDCAPTQPWISPGPCGDVDAGPPGCDLFSNPDCANGGTCVPAPGCAPAGTCMTECTQDMVPYCGCDNITFFDSSTCPHRTFVHAGPCETREGEPCSIFSDVGCGDGLLCAVNQGGCSGNGVCTRFDSCLDNIVQYCSCDGQTLGASSNCVPFAYQFVGACETPDAGPGRPCTSIGNCVSGEACVFPQGCGVTGTCEQLGPCDFPTQWCSCDGVTYQSCEPVRPYVHAGACEGPPPPDAGFFDSGLTDGGFAVDAMSVDAASLDVFLVDATSGDGGIIGACNGARIGTDGLCYDQHGAPYPLSCCRGYACDQSLAFCNRPPPSCATGQVPEVINGCYGPCVLFDNCAVIACDPSNPGVSCPVGTHCDAGTRSCMR